MPPFYGSSYDPAAGFRAAANPYAARRPRQPWGLDWPSWRDTLTPPQASYLDQLPYRPPGARGYPSSTPFNYGNVGAPPAQPTIYADPGQAALYGTTSRPPGYGDQPSLPVVGAPPVEPRSPADQLLQEFLDWKAVNQQNIESDRQQRAYEFDTQQAASKQAALVNAFGVFGQQGAPQGTGQAGEAMSARSAIQQDMLKAQAQRAAVQQAIGAQEAAAQAGPQVLTPPMGDVNQMGLPDRYGLSHAVAAGDVRMAAPYDPRPQWISGPAFGMSADQSAANTMKGNQAFGIHTNRDNVRPSGANPQDYEKFNRMATDTSPEGEAAWKQYEDFVLQNSPRASMLARGEDAGTMTPAERAYLMGLRRRRGAGR
jgi:hypothetical protein